MAVSFGPGAFAEGLGNGVSLYNALMQRDLLRAQTQEEQEKAQQLGTLVPININGQKFMVPQNQAADLMNQEQNRRIQSQYMLQMLNQRQQFQAGELKEDDLRRLANVQSALPVHNAAMALYQAWQDHVSGNQTAAQQGLTMLQSKVAGTSLAPLFEKYGNDPANIPAMYNAITFQGAAEFNKLATTSIRPIPPEEIKSVENQVYPPLSAPSEVGYKMFQHFNDAYIEPQYAAVEAHLNLVRDQNGNITNPTLANEARNVEAQHQATQQTLYQMPGFGPKGSQVGEVAGTIPGLQTNGGPLPGTVQRAPSNPITAAAAPQPQSGNNPGGVPFTPWLGQGPVGGGMNLRGAAGQAPGANAQAANVATAGLPTTQIQPQPRPNMQRPDLNTLLPLSPGGQ